MSIHSTSGDYLIRAFLHEACRRSRVNGTPMQGAYLASRVTYMRKLRVTSPIETEFNPSLLDMERVSSISRI